MGGKKILATRLFRAGAVVLMLGIGSTLQASAQVGADARSVADAEYRINAGDELDIFVWGEERMQRAVRVLPDGTFAFPLAGTITASNRTAREISVDLRERIAKNYRNAPPDVTVSVRDTSGMRFYVLGRVKTPGSYTSVRQINVLQALSVAGGLAEFANIKKAVILRQTPNGQVVEHLNISGILKGGPGLDSEDLANALPVLKSGDVLVIP